MPRAADLHSGRPADRKTQAVLETFRILDTNVAIVRRLAGQMIRHHLEQVERAARIVAQLEELSKRVEK